LNLIEEESGYEFNISYDKALDIAKSKNYGLIQHNNVFKDDEYLNLIFDKEADSYKWIISDVPETKKRYEKKNSVRITGIGKTLFIDCSTGKTKETSFSVQANISS